MEVSASMVKALREKTGAGMMDCKKALTDTQGDMEAAIDWLRKKGLSAAAKKSSRVAADGKVVAISSATRGVLLELNSETDFTAKNEKFQLYATTCANLLLQQDAPDQVNLDHLLTLAYPDTGRTVQEELTQLIATIGENMNLRRIVSLQVNQGMVATYIHMGGKIGVLVGLESAAPTAVLEDLGKKVAMHVAAIAPAYLDRTSVPDEALAREKAILSDQARASGKPESIIEKMMIGRLDKFYGEACLLDQFFVMDQEKTVSKVVEAAAKEAGSPIRITGFARFVLGEGVEKEEKDFAKEVADQLR